MVGIGSVKGFDFQRSRLCSFLASGGVGCRISRLKANLPRKNMTNKEQTTSQTLSPREIELKPKKSSMGVHQYFSRKNHQKKSKPIVKNMPSTQAMPGRSQRKTSPGVLA